jgi:hypothetical protein
LQNSVQNKHQVAPDRERLFIHFVSVLQRKIFRFLEKLLRLPVIMGMSRQAACDRLAKVACVPVCEIASAFRQSSNGGCYDRLAETLIVASGVHDIDNARKVMVEPPPAGVAVIENALICGEGIICKRTSQAIYAASETLTWATSARSILPLRRTEGGALHVDENIRPRKLSTKYTYAFLRQVWDTNYGHWITDCLPKVGILAEHFDIKSLRFIVTRRRGQMQRVYADSLAAFGIESHQILPVGREALEIEQLLYPLPVATHYWLKAPRAIQILEELRDKIASGRSGPRRIYVSRALARNRHLLNETEILDVLRDFDFTVIYPERHSFVEQVRLFADADLVIGNCGANLANAVFSQRGVKIFAITSKIMGDMFYWDLANLKSGKYYSLHGDAACGVPDYNSDFSIDAREFRTLLEERVLSN